MSIFGWCNDGYHEDYEGKWSAPCKGSYEKVVYDERKPKKKNAPVVLSRETINCECPCHQGQPVPPTMKRKK